MPRMTNVISIFLASPSDVISERALITRTIDQWNSTRGREKRIIFDLFKWENSTSSAIGIDGQDVINSQIPDYDAMIALFWTRVGSSTKRADSGSVEEYERVLDRFRDGEQVQIGVYFKNSPPEMDMIDPEQYAGVLKLKRQIEKDGVYHKSFSDDLSLNNEINILLDRLARDYETPLLHNAADFSGVQTDILNASDSQNNLQMVNEEDSIAYYDLLESLESHSESGAFFLSKISEHLDAITSVVNTSTRRFQDLSGLGPIKPADVKQIIADVIVAFDNFNNQIESGIDEFAIHNIGVAEDSRNLIDVLADFSPNSEDSAAGYKSLTELVDSMDGAVEGMQGFAESVGALQRMTVKFNQSRRRVINNVNHIISIIKSSRSIMVEAIDAISMKPRNEIN